MRQQAQELFNAISDKDNDKNKALLLANPHLLNATDADGLLPLVKTCACDDIDIALLILCAYPKLNIPASHLDAAKTLCERSYPLSVKWLVPIAMLLEKFNQYQGSEQLKSCLDVNIMQPLLRSMGTKDKALKKIYHELFTVVRHSLIKQESLLRYCDAGDLQKLFKFAVDFAKSMVATGNDYFSQYLFHEVLVISSNDDVKSVLDFYDKVLVGCHALDKSLFNPSEYSFKTLDFKEGVFALTLPYILLHRKNKQCDVKIYHKLLTTIENAEDYRNRTPFILHFLAQKMPELFQLNSLDQLIVLATKINNLPFVHRTPKDYFEPIIEQLYQVSRHPQWMGNHQICIKIIEALGSLMAKNTQSYDEALAKITETFKQEVASEIDLLLALQNCYTRKLSAIFTVKISQYSLNETQQSAVISAFVACMSKNSQVDTLQLLEKFFELIEAEHSYLLTAEYYELLVKYLQLNTEFMLVSKTPSVCQTMMELNKTLFSLEVLPNNIAILQAAFEHAPKEPEMNNVYRLFINDTIARLMQYSYAQKLTSEQATQFLLNQIVAIKSLTGAPQGFWFKELVGFEPSLWIMTPDFFQRVMLKLYNLSGVHHYCAEKLCRLLKTIRDTNRPLCEFSNLESLRYPPPSYQNMIFVEQLAISCPQLFNDDNFDQLQKCLQGAAVCIWYGALLPTVKYSNQDEFESLQDAIINEFAKLFAKNILDNPAIIEGLPRLQEITEDLQQIAPFKTDNWGRKIASDHKFIFIIIGIIIEKCPKMLTDKAYYSALRQLMVKVFRQFDDWFKDDNDDGVHRVPEDHYHAWQQATKGSFNSVFGRDESGKEGRVRIKLKLIQRQFAQCLTLLFCKMPAQIAVSQLDKFLQVKDFKSLLTRLALIEAVILPTLLFDEVDAANDKVWHNLFSICARFESSTLDPFQLQSFLLWFVKPIAMDRQLTAPLFENYSDIQSVFNTLKSCNSEWMRILCEEVLLNIIRDRPELFQKSQSMNRPIDKLVQLVYLIDQIRLQQVNWVNNPDSVASIAMRMGNITPGLFSLTPSLSNLVQSILPMMFRINTELVLDDATFEHIKTLLGQIRNGSELNKLIVLLQFATDFEGIVDAMDKDFQKGDTHLTKAEFKLLSKDDQVKWLRYYMTLKVRHGLGALNYILKISQKQQVDVNTLILMLKGYERIAVALTNKAPRMIKLLKHKDVTVRNHAVKALWAISQNPRDFAVVKILVEELLATTDKRYQITLLQTFLHYSAECFSATLLERIIGKSQQQDHELLKHYALFLSTQPHANH